jgi:folate-dependent phosphoribosylglycinamide formyltransferase PurN
VSAVEAIVVLAQRSEVSYLLINHLAEQFDVTRVVFEEPNARKLLRHRLRVLGWLIVLGQLVFVGWDRLWIRTRSRTRIAELLTGHDVRPPDGRIPTVDVRSVNGNEVKAVLEECRPAAVVVSGTGIIGRKVLALAPAFINIHAGTTPRYRGVHGGFWAVYEGKPELAGTTVHIVDPGVDTGDILGQAAIEIDPHSDTYRTLPVKQYLVALPLMREAVRSALDGTLRGYRRDDLESRQWYSPTPAQYWCFLRRLRALRARTEPSPAVG